MVGAKDIMVDSQPNEPCDDHGHLKRTLMEEEIAVVGMNEDMVEGSVFEIALII